MDEPNPMEAYFAADDKPKLSAKKKFESAKKEFEARKEELKYKKKLQDLKEEELKFRLAPFKKFGEEVKGNVVNTHRKLKKFLEERKK